MAFTDEEFEAWLDAKLAREFRPTPGLRDRPVATCTHCQRPFSITEGMIADQVAICDVCNGD
jgi:hypothetical protein